MTMAARRAARAQEPVRRPSAQLVCYSIAEAP
jgi:hypothetical protein